MITDNPFTVLKTEPPVLSAAEARGILATVFGRYGELGRLDSERDLNFLVEDENGGRCVLKIANSAEAASITKFQADALRHIASTAPELPVPRIIPGLDGSLVTEIVASDARKHRVRLLTWLDGVPIDETKHSSHAASGLGTCLAKIGRALSDFEHPASRYALLWDLKNAAALTGLLENIADRKLRSLVAASLHRFESATLPILPTLRWQTIHNDLNPGNVLVDPATGDVTGIIDFGDMVDSPLVVDVAVACSYLLADGDDPLLDVVSFVEAYSTVTALAANEIDVLFDLILTRLAMTILIARWRAARYPENRDYILCSESEARQMLARLNDAPHDRITERLRTANYRARRGGAKT